jgi:hypothetical protein
MASITLRVFVSSPGDVGFERRVALAVIERLRGEFVAHVDIRPILWEDGPLRATEHFQEQIANTADVDIAVFVLWTRLGTALPDQFRRGDGTSNVSGTEFEFECAARAYRETGKPSMLAYIEKADRAISLADRASAMEAFAQKEALDRFIDRWFGNPQDTFRAAFKQFETADEFERTLESDLRQLIAERRPGNEAPSRPQVTWSRGSPFRGLAAFDFEHAEIFFGRTRAVGDVRDALVAQAARNCAFLLVLGMSGSGKSSLVHAGVLPAITQPGVIEGVDSWCWCSLRPSGNQNDLMLGLATAILQGLSRGESASDMPAAPTLAALMRHSPATATVELGAALARVAARRMAALGLERPIAVRLIVVVDQFEELFALGDINAEERQLFVATLDALAHSGHIWVIATMRSDFYSRCTELPVLVELKQGAGQYELLAPSKHEIEQMVRAGASAAGLRFERLTEGAESLDEVLIAAASSNPAALPLLEFALEELYLRRTPDAVLTFSAYQAFGGFEGAISQRAEEVHARLSPEAQARLPEVFAHLLTVHLDESRTASALRVPLGGLPDTQEVASIVDAFVTARLFVSDRTSTGEAAISIAHEALLSNWPRLARWAANNQTFLEERAHKQIEAIQWQSHGRDESRLIPAGEQLERAEDFLAVHRNALSREIADYITASTRLRRSSGKFMWLSAAVVYVLFFVFAVVTTLLQSGPSGLKLDQVAPYLGLAIWLLFMAHLRWRADPKRVARRKILVFTLLIATALLFGVAWRVASGVQADGWRSEMISDISAVMIVSYATYIALEYLSTASTAVRARRRKRFWVTFSAVAAALLAVVPTGLIFTAGPTHSVLALTMILAGGLAVLLLTYAPTPGRRATASGKDALDTAASSLRPDRIADTALVLPMLGAMMYLIPAGVDRLRSQIELCGDIDGYFNVPQLRCTAPPRSGFLTFRLEKKNSELPVSRMDLVNAKGRCDGSLPLTPKLQIMRELGFFETGLGFRNYCSSRMSYDTSGKWTDETYYDSSDSRLMYIEEVNGVYYVYGAKPDIYLGRVRRAPDERDGETAMLAEFNPHRIYMSGANGEPQQALPARRWEFNPKGWPLRITHVGSDGRKPVLVPRNGYARVELRYAEDGSLVEASFLDAESKPAVLKGSYAKIAWEYDSDGACVRRIDLTPEGQRVQESACDSRRQEGE